MPRAFFSIRATRVSQRDMRHAVRQRRANGKPPPDGTKQLFGIVFQPAIQRFGQHPYQRPRKFPIRVIAQRERVCFADAAALDHRAFSPTQRHREAPRRQIGARCSGRVCNCVNRLDIERLWLGERGAFLNEAEASFRLVAHKLLYDLGRRRLVGFKIEPVQIAAAAGNLHA